MLLAAAAIVCGIGLFVAGAITGAPVQEDPAGQSDAALASLPSTLVQPPKEEFRIEKSAEQVPEGSAATDLGLLVQEYKELAADGDYDRARKVAQKALAAAGQTDPPWLRRLADATYMCEALADPQRSAAAYAGYAVLIEQPDAGMRSEDREWAQYRACLCLRQMGLWGSATEAAQAFLASFPASSHALEIRLLHAQGLDSSAKRAHGPRRELTQVTPVATPMAEGRGRRALRPASGRLETGSASPPAQTIEAEIDGEKAELARLQPAVVPAPEASVLATSSYAPSVSMALEQALPRSSAPGAPDTETELAQRTQAVKSLAVLIASMKQERAKPPVEPTRLPVILQRQVELAKAPSGQEQDSLQAVPATASAKPDEVQWERPPQVLRITAQRPISEPCIPELPKPAGEPLPTHRLKPFFTAQALTLGTESGRNVVVAEGVLERCLPAPVVGSEYVLVQNGQNLYFLTPSGDVNLESFVGHGVCITGLPLQGSGCGAPVLEVGTVSIQEH